MKCPKCGFISFDDLISCKKCGTNFKVTEQETEKCSNNTSDFKCQSYDTHDECVNSNDAKSFPPTWAETIQSIKKDLEEIEGAPVDRTSSILLKKNDGNESISTKRQEGNDNFMKSYQEVLKAAKGGFFLRLVAYSIDCSILFIITVIPIIAIAIFMKEPSFSVANSRIIDRVKMLFLPYAVGSAVIEMFYFTYCHAVTGQTIGKWICGLKVVRTNGEILGFKRALLRWIGYVINRFFCILAFAGFYSTEISRAGMIRLQEVM